MTARWADSFLQTLKANDIRLVSYVPDNVLTPLIAGAAADNYFMSVGAVAMLDRWRQESKK
jgi:hypothetical protein